MKIITLLLTDGTEHQIPIASWPPEPEDERYDEWCDTVLAEAVEAALVNRDEVDDWWVGS